MNQNNSSQFKPRKKIRFSLNKQDTSQEIFKLIKRLYLQTYRRPSGLIISIIQPLLWLVLFGALFQYAPIYLFEKTNMKYRDFLNPGIIIFTSFNSSINAGLPIIFDREFGFINRILSSPIKNKNSLVYSCILHTLNITLVQILIITLITSNNINNNYSINVIKVILCTSIITIITTSISNISICNAFILPGHIEFIALNSLLINLPTLFASTALAPMSFMPYWLQVICCINPLTYAIEITRYNMIDKILTLNTYIIKTSWLTVNIKQGIVILLLMNVINFLLVRRIIKYKYD
uniref:ABC transmembrane type-2 domain-containing protein n=1 Tax=Polysiphonia scopulorum TaxID=257860 RepID=A0A1Z1MHU9_9FLOR|nr:hypothetical protein [Polysiphonia scopulorum]ARW65660.1 hypothetical protein [Polysiphonia scopulorum]